MKFGHILTSCKGCCFCLGTLRFCKEKDTRAYDLADHTCHAKNGVELPKLILRKAGKNSQAEDSHTLVGKLQDLKDHGIKICRSFHNTWNGSPRSVN